MSTPDEGIDWDFRIDGDPAGCERRRNCVPSDTPETNAAAGRGVFVHVDFARGLERQRDEWRKTAIIYMICTAMAVFLLVTGCATRPTEQERIDRILNPPDPLVFQNGQWRSR